MPDLPRGNPCTAAARVHSLPGSARGRLHYASGGVAGSHNTAKPPCSCGCGWCPRRRRRRPRRRRVAIRTGSRPSRPSRASSAARLRILLSHLQSHLTVRCLALEEHCTKDSLFTGQTLARRRGRSTGTRGRTCQRQAQPRETLAACRMDSLSELGASLPHTARYDQHAVYP